MKDSTVKRIIARVHSEMCNLGLKASSDMHLNFNVANMIRLDSDAPGIKSGWLIVYTKPDHLTIIFGNFKTGQNHACLAVRPEKLDGHIWCAFCREILSSRESRELLLNNKIAIAQGNNIWEIRQMETKNDN